MRGCSVIGNTHVGVKAIPLSTMTVPSVAIDLGTADDPGMNVLQSSSTPNGDAGLCNLTVDAWSAVGNSFSGCPPSVSQGCTGGLDIGLGPTAPGPDTSQCQLAP
jgi:hypothetical protein